MSKDKRKRGDERETPGALSGEVLHGGAGDPLGGGVADLEASDDVSEGIPEQDEERGAG